MGAAPDARLRRRAGRHLRHPGHVGRRLEADAHLVAVILSGHRRAVHARADLRPQDRPALGDAPRIRAILTAAAREGRSVSYSELLGDLGFRFTRPKMRAVCRTLEEVDRLCALDGLRRTIYVGGFAKILAPNWRIGFLAASPALCARLLETKLLSTLTTPALFERALSACIDQGQLRRHAERVRTRLDGARARTVKLALAHGCRFESEPAGLFGWVDTGVDTDALTQRMLDRGYMLAPGSLFHAARTPGTLMRINFATTQDATFWGVFSELRRGG